MGGKGKKKMDQRQEADDGRGNFEDWFHGFMNTGHDARGAGATSQRLHILGLTLSTLFVFTSIFAFSFPFLPFMDIYHLQTQL